MLTKETLQEELSGLGKQKEKAAETLDKLEKEQERVVRFLQQVEGGEKVLRNLLGKLDREQDKKEPDSVGTLTV